MQNIIQLFARFGTQITFLLFMVISFSLIIKFNNSQRSIFLNSSSYYASKIDSKANEWQGYLSLQEVNDSLSRQNAELLERFINLSSDIEVVDDTTRHYQLIPARVIRSTYHLRNNHLTIDKGTKDGVERDMGVLTEKGLLGIVRNVSDNFAHIVSVLNSQIKISATVSPYAYPGNLVWKDMDPKRMFLESIPKHIDIAVGDTILTNGYSTIFPEGIEIGTVESYDVDRGSSDYNITVLLAGNVPNAKVGYVIVNNMKEEQLAIEKIDNE